MPFNTATVGTAVTPTVISTLLSHASLWHSPTKLHKFNSNCLLSTSIAKRARPGPSNQPRTSPTTKASPLSGNSSSTPPTTPSKSSRASPRRRFPTRHGSRPKKSRSPRPRSPKPPQPSRRSSVPRASSRSAARHGGNGDARAVS